MVRVSSNDLNSESQLDEKKRYLHRATVTTIASVAGVLGLLALASCPLYAQEAPIVYTGTNYITSCDWYQDPPFSPSDPYITGVSIKINGQYIYQKQSLSVHYWKAAVQLDTTHFPDNSKITEVASGTLSDGTTFSTTTTGTVVNRAYVMANKYFKKASPKAVSASMALAGIRCDATENANADSIRASLPNYTVFYANTHAYYNAFADCLWTDSLSTDRTHAIYANDIPTALEKKDSRNPPIPPYSLVYIDGCNAAGVNGETRTLLSGAFNIGNGVSLDRAFIGYAYSYLDSPDWIRIFFNSMGRGNTIDKARADADEKAYLSGANEPGYEGKFGDFVGHVSSFNIEPVVLGDGQTKIHGLYGQPGWSQAWYAVVPDSEGDSP